VPLKQINLESNMPPNEVKSLPPAAGLTMVTPPPGGAPSIRVEKLQPTEAPRTQRAPAYALSATRQPENGTGAAIPKPIKGADEAKSAHQWTVQVASAAQQKDAEALAGVLRNKGYDAYVIAADVEGKTWHRVRVGQSLTRAEASKLQKTLQVAEKFESSYVLSR
jgi:DedD protein